jgi:hypothetical protein
MDARQLELWHEKRLELFHTRLSHELTARISAVVAKLDYARALVALANYRNEPYRGFYPDQFVKHYERTEPQTTGQRGKAAEAAPPARTTAPDGIDPTARAREMERFERLPPEFVRECETKYAELGYAPTGICWAIICLDAWDGRDVERYRQHVPYFSPLGAAQRARLAASRYSEQLTAQSEVERLRMALRAATDRITELMGGVDVRA